jgi:hypothetical protein
MRTLFSAQGTVSRGYFRFCVLLHMLAVPLGMALVALSWDWAREQMEWIARGWRAIIPVVVLYLIAYRIFACAYVKRARAIGVEITLGEVWYCFMGFERGASIKDLLSPVLERDRVAGKLADGRAQPDHDD